MMPAMKWKSIGSVAFALGLAAGAADAQTWPDRAVHVVVPLTAGSATDVMARIVARQLSLQLGQPFVVENRPGAGGTIGTAAVARARPDGYTLLVQSASYTVTPTTYPNTPYDTRRDLMGVTPLGLLPQALVVAPTRGIDSVHVPFKGTPEALTEVMAGRVDYYFCPVNVCVPMIREKRLLALGMGSSKRSAALLDLPTTLELGVPNSDYDFWVGLFMPSGTPREILDRLYTDTAKAIGSPELRQDMAKLGAEANLTPPDAYNRQLRQEIVDNAALVKAAGIPIGGAQ